LEQKEAVKVANGNATPATPEEIISLSKRKYGVDNETSEVAYTDNQWSVYLNLCKEYRQDKSASTIKTSFQEGKICREKKEHSHHR
jgi:ATP-dependent DNA helicase RecG